jgi:hypothetical protein
MIFRRLEKYNQLGDTVKLPGSVPLSTEIAARHRELSQKNRSTFAFKYFQKNVFFVGGVGATQKRAQKNQKCEIDRRFSHF